MLSYTLVVITPSNILCFDLLPALRRAVFDALAFSAAECGDAETAGGGIGDGPAGHGAVVAEETVRDFEGRLRGAEGVGEVAG